MQKCRDAESVATHRELEPVHQGYKIAVWVPCLGGSNRCQERLRCLVNRINYAWFDSAYHLNLEALCPARKIMTAYSTRNGHTSCRQRPSLYLMVVTETSSFSSRVAYTRTASRPRRGSAGNGVGLMDMVGPLSVHAPAGRDQNNAARLGGHRPGL
eukprot:365321-Chlamydomonas_euryale.AAC.3